MLPGPFSLLWCQLHRPCRHLLLVLRCQLRRPCRHLLLVFTRRHLIPCWCLFRAMLIPAWFTGLIYRLSGCLVFNRRDIGRRGDAVQPGLPRIRSDAGIGNRCVLDVGTRSWGRWGHHVMRAFQITIVLSLTLLYCGCRREPATPLSFYLSDQEPSIKGTSIPTNSPVLTVTRLRFVAPDNSVRKITIKFYPKDADAVEKLTTDNLGKTVVMIQGTNVLTVSRVTVPISARAGFLFPVSTNVDFDAAVRELLRLSH